MLIMCWYGSHAYLNDYITQNKCKRIMELGVYNGQNAATMIKAAIKNHPPEQVEYYGFDFFNYYTTHKISEKLEKLGCKYTLIQGNTLDTVPKAAKTLPKMDMIFIDGGKSYREAWSDWQGSSNLMHRDTAVYVHNAGFSGVSRMIEDIPREKYEVELFNPRFEGKVALIKRKE